jgi:hypothetical protein
MLLRHGSNSEINGTPFHCNNHRQGKTKTIRQLCKNPLAENPPFAQRIKLLIREGWAP